MNKIILLICALLTITTACAASSTKKEVIFYSASGSAKYKKYNTATFRKEINEVYRVAPETIVDKMVVVAAKDRESPEFISQSNVLHSIHAEKYAYIHIRANIENPGVDYRDAYHTDVKQAEIILNGSPFKIIVFDENGGVIVESTSVISRSELEQYLTRPKVPLIE